MIFCRQSLGGSTELFWNWEKENSRVDWQEEKDFAKFTGAVQEEVGESD